MSYTDNVKKMIITDDNSYQAVLDYYYSGVALHTGPDIVWAIPVGIYQGHAYYFFSASDGSAWFVTAGLTTDSLTEWVSKHCNDIILNLRPVLELLGAPVWIYDKKYPDIRIANLEFIKRCIKECKYASYKAPSHDDALVSKDFNSTVSTTAFGDVQLLEATCFVAGIDSVVFANYEAYTSNSGNVEIKVGMDHASYERVPVANGVTLTFEISEWGEGKQYLKPKGIADENSFSYYWLSDSLDPGVTHQELVFWGPVLHARIKNTCPQFWDYLGKLTDALGVDYIVMLKYDYDNLDRFFKNELDGYNLSNVYRGCKLYRGTGIELPSYLLYPSSLKCVSQVHPEVLAEAMRPLWHHKYHLDAYAVQSNKGATRYLIEPSTIKGYHKPSTSIIVDYQIVQLPDGKRTVKKVTNEYSHSYPFGLKPIEEVVTARGASKPVFLPKEMKSTFEDLLSVFSFYNIPIKTTAEGAEAYYSVICALWCVANNDLEFLGRMGICSNAEDTKELMETIAPIILSDEDISPIEAFCNTHKMLGDTEAIVDIVVKYATMRLDIMRVFETAPVALTRLNKFVNAYRKKSDSKLFEHPVVGIIIGKVMLADVLLTELLDRELILSEKE